MIRVIAAADTYPLRHQVLWPKENIEFIKVPEDNTGIHIGYFVADELVSVISFFIDKQRNARFRKFATHPNFQKKGIGSQLLRHVFELALELKAAKIWCDARLDAMPLYTRFGMKKVDDVFFKEDIPYIKMERIFQQ